MFALLKCTEFTGIAVSEYVFFAMQKMRIFDVSKRKTMYATIILNYPHNVIIDSKLFFCSAICNC